MAPQQQSDFKPVLVFDDQNPEPEEKVPGVSVVPGVTVTTTVAV